MGDAREGRGLQHVARESHAVLESHIHLFCPVRHSLHMKKTRNMRNTGSKVKGQRGESACIYSTSCCYVYGLSALNRQRTSTRARKRRRRTYTKYYTHPPCTTHDLAHTPSTPLLSFSLLLSFSPSLLPSFPPSLISLFSPRVLQGQASGRWRLNSPDQQQQRAAVKTERHH